jgi:Spy/CpxP family protein refolding chaperone
MKSKVSSNATTVSKGVVSAALSIAAGVAMDVSQSNPCLAQDSAAASCSVDWSKLNLTASQAAQIKELDQEWYKEYADRKRQIVDEQGKLQRALSDHTSEPMQVVALQQSVESRKGELRIIATRIYLAKKKVLDEDQKKQLEDMMRIVVANRKNQMYPGSQTEVMPDKIQSLMQRVRGIWPVNSEH